MALTRSYESEGPVSEGHIYSVGIPYNEIFLAARCFLVQVYLVVRLPEKGLPMVGLPHGPGHGRHAHQGEQLAREEEVLAKDQDPVRIFPWRRCWARELDLAIYGAVLVLVLAQAMGAMPIRANSGTPLAAKR